MNQGADAYLAWYRLTGIDLGWQYLVGNRLKEKCMFYAVLINRGTSKAEDLADAVIGGALKPASVYVVGMSDANAFATALIDGAIEVDADLNAVNAMQFEWVHAMGTEDGSSGSLMLLLSAAKNLVNDINAAGGHEQWNKHLARFTHRRT